MKKLVRKFIGHLTDDEKLMLKTAHYIDVPEIEVMRRAYIDWNLDAPVEKHLEILYLSFFHSGVMPFWCRDFCRKVLE